MSETIHYIDFTTLENFMRDVFIAEGVPAADAEFCANVLITADKLGIDSSFFKNNDIHIHVPEGAIPKDGPSAGITITTAVISKLTGIPVKGTVAMTGEITLLGRVLPIGGLKEKLLAAKRLGIKTVIVPIENKKDVLEIPASVVEGMEIVYAKTMADVLSVALVSSPLK